MMHLTLTPAYGSDYKSKKEVIEAFDNNKDFILSTPFHPDSGRYCNKEDLKTQVSSVNIRYKKLTQIAVVKL